MSPLDDNVAFFTDAIVRPGAARVVAFEPWHLPLLTPREHEVAAFAALGGAPRAAALCDEAEHAYTVMTGSATPVACIGCTVMWAGVGTAWAFLSPAALCHWRLIHGSVRMFLSQAFSSGEFRRIQTSVRADHEAGRRWAEHLGFVIEGPEYAYCPDGADAIRYVRLR